LLISEASFNEKLVVNNGQVVCPQPIKGSTAHPPPSMNQLIHQIDNDRDFDDYILKNASKGPMTRSEQQYVKHPTQSSGQSYPTAPTNNDRRTSLLMQGQQSSFSMQQPDMNPSSPVRQQPHPPEPEPQFSPGYPDHQPPSSQPPQLQETQLEKSAPPQGPSNPYPQPDYPRGPVGQATAQQTSGVLYNSSQPPVNPVFGVTLEELFNRDGSPVPMVVYQCIQAVDLFGLEVEGIYRIPGTSSHIQQMKNLFDSGK
jgi:hypothetical protein